MYVGNYPTTENQDMENSLLFLVVNHLLSPPSLGKQLRDTVYQLTIVNLIYIALTHELQKTAQEAKALWLQVQNRHNFSIITSLPSFALFFILGLSRESQTIPVMKHVGFQLVASPPLAPECQNLQSGHT